MLVVAGSGSESMLTSSVHDSPYVDGIILGVRLVEPLLHLLFPQDQAQKAGLDAAIAQERAPSSAFSLTFKVVILTCTAL